MTPGQRKLVEWRYNPCKFVYENFQVEPDNWQRKALEAFASQEKAMQRISLQACAGPGKSAVLAWCGWNFLSCYGDKGEHPKGAAVSVNHDNLKDNLWAEMSKWQGRSPFLLSQFDWNKERIASKRNPSTWFISARTWSKTSNAEEQGRTLSGLHSKFVLALIDESGEIPVSVLKAGEQALSTNPLFGKLLQAGNPTSLDGMLYVVATMLKHQWHVIRITGDPDDPDRSARIDIEWAREQIKNYGRDNPWVMAYILGLFPPSSINTLFGPDEVSAAMKRHLREDIYSGSQKRIGCDVARFGDDSTVLAPRQGLAAFKMAEMRNARTNDIAARLMAAKVKFGSEREYIDGTGGYGAGVADAMVQAGHSPLEVNFSGRAMDAMYYNKRSEMWFLMADWCKRGAALPNDPQLQRELCAPTYTFYQGKLRLEEKEQIKARLGFSPDRADALALTFAEPEMPAALGYPHNAVQNQTLKPNSDYNPLDNA